MVRKSKPDLSIIIASYLSRNTIQDCLESLHRQKTDKAYEIILVDSSRDGTAEFVQRQFPGVRLLSFPTRLYPGEARNRGMSLVQAEIVAFVDTDCRVGRDWVDAVLEAHASPYLAVGGVVDNGTPENLVAWAYLFCEFSLWLPKTQVGTTPEAPGCCLSIKRAAWERYGPFLAGTYCSDTAFLWQLAAHGHRVLFFPPIRVFHTYRDNWRAFVKHILEHRRSFASVTCREKRLGPWERLWRVVQLPLHPYLLLIAQTLRLRRSPGYFSRFLAAAPLIFLGNLARAWAEAQGYLRPVPARLTQVALDSQPSLLQV